MRLQGFHDVCSVCLLVCGERLGASVAAHLATHQLKAIMRPSRCSAN